MTNTLEQRDLLARIGELVWRAERLGNAQVTLEELRAIEAALRLSAGADGWTLELYRGRDGELGVWAKQEGGSRVWIARAAAPRHETGEVRPCPHKSEQQCDCANPPTGN